MSSAGSATDLPAPSVFISYASEDRTAARALRDALQAAGLQVWYDESELTGGDAWDQKIRRQIRDCDYFLPIISANTERRKEGYFRREWRLAVERTMDMADDVLFLLPVVIDDTTEANARVPDRFLTVQWLRAPAGQPTPALQSLIERIRAGDHQLYPRLPGATRPPMYQRTVAPFGPPPCPPPDPPPLAKCDPAPSGPPPPQVPPIPPTPEKGGFFHGIRFVFELLWWALTAAWILFSRLPKWGRVLVVVWIVISLFSTRCSNSSSPRVVHTGGERPGSGRGIEREKKARQFAERISQSAREGGITLDSAELSKLGTEIAQVFVEGFGEGPGTGRPLLIVPFAPTAAEDPASKFAHAVFLSLYGRLSLERRGDIAVTAPIPDGNLTAPLLARGRQLGANFMLTASPVPATTPPGLKVQLLAVSDSSVSWSETFPAEGADATSVAEKIAEQVLPLVPRKGPRRGK